MGQRVAKGEGERDQAVHASCVVVGTRGLLIRGPSGSGKSGLVNELMDRANSRGQFAALVSDDRVYLEALSGRLVATAPVTIQGLLEIRGRGIVQRPFLTRAIVSHVVDFVPLEQLERMPQDVAMMTQICGLKLPRQPIPVENFAVAVRLAEEALESDFG